MLSQIYASIGSFLPQPMKQRSLNYQKFVAIIMEKFSVLIVFPNDRNKLCSNLYED